MKEIRPAKEIIGVEPSVGYEWDAGWVPEASAFRRVRIAVRKLNEKEWQIHATGYRGAVRLGTDRETPILILPCETCAKAFALDLVHGRGYSYCAEHGTVFDETQLFDGTLVVLVVAMNLSYRNWIYLGEDARNKVCWTARLILDGKITWHDAISAWERVAQSCAEFRTAIDVWYVEIARLRTGGEKHGEDTNS